MREVLWGKRPVYPEAGFTNDPTFTIRRFRSSAANDYPNYLAGRERAIEGMRRSWGRLTR
jgi:hypothetical protein